MLPRHQTPSYRSSTKQGPPGRGGGCGDTSTSPSPAILGEIGRFCIKAHQISIGRGVNISRRAVNIPAQILTHIRQNLLTRHRFQSIFGSHLESNPQSNEQVPSNGALRPPLHRRRPRRLMIVRDIVVLAWRSPRGPPTTISRPWDRSGGDPAQRPTPNALAREETPLNIPWGPFNI